MQLHFTAGIYYGGGLLCGGLKFHFHQNDWSEIFEPKWNSFHPNSCEPFQRTDKKLKWDFHLKWIFKSVWVHFESHVNVLKVRIGKTLTGIIQSIYIKDFNGYLLIFTWYLIKLSRLIFWGRPGKISMKTCFKKCNYVITDIFSWSIFINLT